MYRKQVRRRRAVLVLLIVASLVLLSATFSQAGEGPVGSIQRGAATVLSPVEDVASRALKPARDLINWFRETFNARGENAELKAQVQDLQRRLAQSQSAQGELAQLRPLVRVDRIPPVSEYNPVTARVIARSPTVWYSTVTVDRGSSSGVAVNDPVITGDGLVGRVSATTRSTAQVTLITDHRSAVSARVLPDGPDGVLEPEAGDPSTLLLDFISPDQKIEKGAILVTAGWSNGQISSKFPYGIRIGRVTSATSSPGEAYQRVNVQAFADLRGLDYVQILTGGPPRPGLLK